VAVRRLSIFTKGLLDVKIVAVFLDAFESFFSALSHILRCEGTGTPSAQIARIQKGIFGHYGAKSDE